MPLSKTKKEPYKGEKIKLKLNSKTFILVHNMDSVKVWKKQYPQAEIIK